MGAIKSDYLADRIGSTIGLSDATTNMSTTYSYEVFGNATPDGALDVNETMFSARENDMAGVMYFRARYYDPHMGRFMSEDPLGLGGGLANLYSYVDGDPVNNTDAFGLKDYDERETAGWLMKAFCASTAGRWQGLLNIKHNSQNAGPFDFHYNGERDNTWIRNGVRMRSNGFGNYIAGFAGAVSDRRYKWTTGILWGAEASVKVAGIYYHMKGMTEAKNDPWDCTGFPMINAGEADGEAFGSVCGCGR